MHFSALLAVAAATVASAATAPGLTFLYSSNTTTGEAITYGATTGGERIAVPLTGGTFSGPRMNGTILAFGADWGCTDALGKYNPDTRYSLLTDDGVPIYIQTTGPTTADGTIHQRLIFQTSANSTYAWLNEIVAVGIVTLGTDGSVAVDAWQLETPVEDTC